MADQAEGRSIKELRGRIDGFTAEKQKAFLKALRRTGCVKDAARKAGISTTSIDRARRQFADFDGRCRAALALATPKLEAIAFQRATVGARAKVIRKGVVVEVRQKPSDAILRLLLQGADPLRYGRMAGLAQIEKKRRKADGRRGQDEEMPIEAVRDEVLRQVAAIRRHRIDAEARADAEGAEGAGAAEGAAETRKRDRGARECAFSWAWRGCNSLLGFRLVALGKRPVAGGFRAVSACPREGFRRPRCVRSS